MTIPIHHIALTVADFTRSRDFYTASLGTLGIQLLAELEADGRRHAGYGVDRGIFWIGDGKRTLGDAHVAFAARSRSEVESFYTVALSMGGRDNGPPGLRRHYGPNYYAAFVLDPDGNNIEAVFTGAEDEK